MRRARDAAFMVYLAALTLLPFRWLSPFGSLQEHGTWTDALVAVAAALWLADAIAHRTLRQSLRTWQLPLAAYLALACLSAVFRKPGAGGSWTTVLIMLELVVLAVVTADFAAEARRRRQIARAIIASAAATIVLSIIGEVLFYAGLRSGLVGLYGALQPSHLYARVQAGFESPPLLGSFCIFASGVAASREAEVGRRLRLGLEVALGLVCLATFSRALLGFILALVLRASRRLPRRPAVAVAVTCAIVAVLIIAALSAGQLRGDPAHPSTFSYVIPAPHDRREDFTSSLSTLEHHPLLGVGPGALPGHNAAEPARAHFTPLNVAATLGLPALACLAAALILLWRSRRPGGDFALWTALAGIALDGLAGDIDHYRHVWILLGLVGWMQPADHRPRPRSAAADPR